MVKTALREGHSYCDIFEDVTKTMVEHGHQKIEEWRIKTNGMLQAYKKALTYWPLTNDLPLLWPAGLYPQRGPWMWRGSGWVKASKGKMWLGRTAPPWSHPGSLFYHARGERRNPGRGRKHLKWDSRWVWLCGRGQELWFLTKKPALQSQWLQNMSFKATISSLPCVLLWNFNFCSPAVPKQLWDHGQKTFQHFQWSNPHPQIPMWVNMAPSRMLSSPI